MRTRGRTSRRGWGSSRASRKPSRKPSASRRQQAFLRPTHRPRDAEVDRVLPPRRRRPRPRAAALAPDPLRVLRERCRGVLPDLPGPDRDGPRRPSVLGMGGHVPVLPGNVLLRGGALVPRPPARRGPPPLFSPPPPPLRPPPAFPY